MPQIQSSDPDLYLQVQVCRNKIWNCRTRMQNWNWKSELEYSIITGIAELELKPRNMEN